MSKLLRINLAEPEEMPMLNEIRLTPSTNVLRLCNSMRTAMEILTHFGQTPPPFWTIQHSFTGTKCSL